MKKLLVATLLLTLASCGGSSYQKSALDVIIQGLDQEKNFTIILFDMNVEGSLSKDYFHKYKIVKEGKGEEDLPKEEITEWYKVSENEFDIHVNDLGMEVASKKDGVLSKNVAPPGYSNYVGNSRYGQWRSDNSGNSFWSFYGKYAFMSSMMGLVSGPVYRNSYSDWNSNYRTSSRPYYGRTIGGVSSYGTASTAARKQNPTFYNRAQTNSALKSTVNNKVSRSPSTASRVSRSSSRYSSGSSTKSRSMSRGGK
ncbi:hypothetical protein R9C00_29060 [Flammeovirgaceae bacterium SG7u.111]|nr:hypothetical protein [Flammeovirgaceae bacterium SG7u.132]WPO35750.1 hypothetical protein R9C00_29060 [Flammeovirgaceae bacterium SG7u.111]